MIDFCKTLEKVCISTVDGVQMTMDFALIIHGKDFNESHYLIIMGFLEVLDSNLKAVIA